MAPQREWFDTDYYAVLGVPATADDKTLTKAYRKLAKQFHPDANQGSEQAEARFKEISAAYEVLGDKEHRPEYDEVRQMVANGARPGGGGGFGGGGFDPRGFQETQFDASGFDGAGLGDIFSGLFQRRGRGATPANAGPRRGDDLETSLHLGFREAIEGVTTSVRFTAPSTCSVCKGTRAEPGTSPIRCPQCDGRGEISSPQGPFAFSEVCPRCQGAGSLVEHPCRHCGGTGVEVRSREVKVRIPPGVSDGQRIRAKGRGAPGANGGRAGDLFVQVSVERHPLFQRKGDHDLAVRVPITIPEAALGAEIRVPTLDEPVKLKVKPGTQSGTTVRVRKRGVPAEKGESGSLFVTFDVAIPQELNEAQAAAMRALAEADPSSPRAHLEV
jgi:molecular chaperone DnaJ